MDPDAALARIRELSQDLSNNEDALELANLIRELDAWLSNGGFFPREWRPF
jgi:hypothetical protein